MKKILTVALALCLAAACLFALPLTAHAAEEPMEKTVVISGVCGKNLTWTLYDDGSLVISGTGAMDESKFSTASPWNTHISVIKSVVIEMGVTDIAAKAFSNCTKLESVNIGTDVTRIGAYAFSGCEALTAVTIPSSVTNLEEYAFAECGNLDRLTMGSGVKEIKEYTFSGCKSLRTLSLPEGLEKIGDYAFADCAGVQAVLLPKSLKSLGAYAFSGCSSLAAITVPSSVTALGDGVFMGCAGLKSVSIPAGITTLGYCLFQDCSSLKTFTIPEGVTTLADQVFLGCKALETVHIPESVTAIGKNVFWDCKKLKTVALPAGLTTLGEAAFYGCSALETVALPAGITELGNHLFAECTALKTVTFPENVTAMGNYMFYRCESLEAVALPAGVADIGAYQFFGCLALEKITVPAAVLEIGDFAFYGCSGLAEIHFTGDAPVFGAGVFGGVTATAYYGADNETWLPELRQNYGGNITWVAVGGEHTVTWISASTTLGGNIGLNFYVELSNSLTQDASTFMRFTFAGNTLDVPLSAATLTDGQYKFTCPVNAKNMADAVTAQVMTANGIVGESKELAVVTYCNYMIQYGGDADLASLMKAMLNYGAAAQVLFNHNTQNLANAGLSEADKVLAEVDASGYAASVTGSEDGIALSSASLMLETETSIRIYFKLTGSKTIDAFTFFVDGKEVTPVQKDGAYYVEIADIAAQDLDAAHTVTVGGITVIYSGLSYVNTVVNNQAIAGEALVNAAKALFAYNKLAEAYFN